MATAVWFERVDVVSLKRKLVLQIFGSSTNLPMIPSSPTASLPGRVEDATADMALTAFKRPPLLALPPRLDR